MNAKASVQDRQVEKSTRASIAKPLRQAPASIVRKLYQGTLASDVWGQPRPLAISCA